MGHWGSPRRLVLVAAAAVGILLLGGAGIVLLGRGHQPGAGLPDSALAQTPTAQPDVPVYCSDARQACIAGVDLLVDVEGPLIAQRYRCGPGSPPRTIACLKEMGPGRPTYKLEIQPVGRGVASMEASVTVVAAGAAPPVDQATPLVVWMAQLPFKGASQQAEEARQWVVGHLPTTTTSRPLYSSINHYSYHCSGLGVDTGGFQSWTIDCGVTANYVP